MSNRDDSDLNGVSGIEIWIYPYFCIKVTLSIFLEKEKAGLVGFLLAAWRISPKMPFGFTQAAPLAEVAAEGLAPMRAPAPCRRAQTSC